MAVLGSLELLKKRVSAEASTMRLIDNAIHGAERGAALTQRLLAFARRQELKPESVSMSHLVDGMQGLLERALGPGVQFQVDLPPQLPAVRVDPNQLELALLNLAVNARDAMPGGGSLTLSAKLEHIDRRADLAPGDYLRITVADSGVGMDEQTLAKATEPFFTTKGVGKGTGLGLSMVHGLAAQSGGLLTISSRPGSGSTVELWLPRADSAPRPQEPEREDAMSDGSDSITVLVVDDDALVCMGTSAMLEDLGHATIEARSGKEALELLRNHPEIGLVITDHAMPGMTGAELAARIQQCAPNLPLILATGYAELPDGGHTPAKVPRLSKPFRQSELAAAIARSRGA
jgi:CheY-like chemotaxis protein